MQRNVGGREGEEGREREGGERRRKGWMGEEGRQRGKGGRHIRLNKSRKRREGNWREEEGTLHKLS